MALLEKLTACWVLSVGLRTSFVGAAVETWTFRFGPSIVPRALVAVQRLASILDKHDRDDANEIP